MEDRNALRFRIDGPFLDDNGAPRVEPLLIELARQPLASCSANSRGNNTSALSVENRKRTGPLKLCRALRNQ